MSDDHCRRCEERLVTPKDIEAEVVRHLDMLDKLWPDHETYGARKVHIVELLTDLRLALLKRADKNATAHVSSFQRAARKVTGFDPTAGVRETAAEIVSSYQGGPTTAEQHQALKDRIKRNS